MDYLAVSKLTDWAAGKKGAEQTKKQLHAELEKEPVRNIVST